ncbi:MAG: AAA family ATPase [Deltaproteobacteria bacterium]|nr:AAA family ATPase [Deltaproteobacteria bacterium]
MYIERLTLRDIKGFGEAEFDFRRPDGSLAGWNVLAGRNGSGKSTVLKTIAMVLRGPQYAPKMEIDFGGWVRQRAKSGGIDAIIHFDPHGDQFQKSPGDRRRLELGLELDVFFQAHADSFVAMDSDVHTALVASGSKTALELARKGPWLAIPGTGWMLAGYGPFRRLRGESRDAHKVMSDTSGVGSVATLFREDASLIDGSIWAQDLWTRHQLREAQRSKRKRPGTLAGADLLSGVGRLIEHGLLPDGIRWAGVDDEGVWFQQGSFRLRLEQLSDGFRSTLALLLDLLRQLQLTYGSTQLIEHGSEVPHVPHPGVVLIDEAETHLHPGWQQRLGPWLVQHFPNLQFIVTTHSPFICQSASEGGLFKLEPPGSEEPVRKLDDDEFWRVVNGSADDALLTSLFGLEQSHSQHSERLRDELARLGVKQLRTRLTKKEQARLHEIERQLPTGPGPEIEKLLRVRQKED